MFDRAASIELDLPYVPRVDDVMYLSDEQSEMLRQKIIKKIIDTDNYFPYRECLGLFDHYKERGEENEVDLEYLGIEDWIYVEAVAMHTKDNTIIIGLTNSLS